VSEANGGVGELVKLRSPYPVSHLTPFDARRPSPSRGGYENHTGFSPASISFRRDSRNGGSASFSTASAASFTASGSVGCA
jgi:hypothetical protein